MNTQKKEESSNMDYLNNLYELKMKLLDSKLSEDKKNKLSNEIETLELEKRFPIRYGRDDLVKERVESLISQDTNGITSISKLYKAHLSQFLEEFDEDIANIFNIVSNKINPNFIENYVKLLLEYKNGDNRIIIDFINSRLITLSEDKGEFPNNSIFYKNNELTKINLTGSLSKFSINTGETTLELNKEINRYIESFFDIDGENNRNRIQEQKLKDEKARIQEQKLKDEKARIQEQKLKDERNKLYKKIKEEIKASNSGSAYKIESNKTNIYKTINQINDLLGTKSPFISEAFMKQIKVEKILEFKDFSQDLYSNSDNIDIPNKRFINNVINGINAISNGETVEHYVDRISDSTGGDNKKKEIIEKIECFII